MSEQTESLQCRAAEERRPNEDTPAGGPSAAQRAACGRTIAGPQAMTGDSELDAVLAREACARCSKCTATNWFRAFLHDESMLRMRTAVSSKAVDNRDS